MVKNIWVVFFFICKVALLWVDDNYHREFFIKGLALSAVSMLKSNPNTDMGFFA
jgi:hypothetical protein